jgi:hypothetical protein
VPRHEEDINQGVFDVIDSAEGMAVMNRLHLTLLDGVPGIHTRGALLREIGALVRMAYQAGKDAGVAEQLTTVLGR